jgi:hypothetical protein
VPAEPLPKGISGGGVGKAEADMELLFSLVSTPAAADWDASFTVERINLWENVAKASRRKCEFDQMREVPFVRKADDLALATSHLAQNPYCLISCSHSLPDGSFAILVERHRAMNPAARVRCNMWTKYNWAAVIATLN